MHSIVFKYELTLPIPIFVPFTDISTIHGIVINILNQAYLSLIGFAGSSGIEVFTCMVKNTVWASAVAICFSIDEISESIKQTKPSRAIDKEFRNILIQLQDYDRYGDYFSNNGFI